MIEQEIHQYEAGTILEIPFNIKINVKNYNEQILELIIIKASVPKNKGGLL